MRATINNRRDKQPVDTEEQTLQPGHRQAFLIESASFHSRGTWNSRACDVFSMTVGPDGKAIYEIAWCEHKLCVGELVVMELVQEESVSSDFFRVRIWKRVSA